MSKGMVRRGWKTEVDHGCVQKIRHESREAALAVVAELDPENGQVYPCPFCDGWHWGRSRTHPEWPEHVVRQWRTWARLQRKIGTT